MVQLAQERFPIASMNESTVQVSIYNARTDLIAAYLSESELNYAAQILAANRRVPQESLTTSELLSKPKRGWRFPKLRLGLTWNRAPLQASIA